MTPCELKLLLCDVFDGEHNVSMHTHSGAELILVESGTCALDIGGVRYRGEAGSMFFIPPETEHNQLNYGVVRDRYCAFVISDTEWNQRSGVIEIGRDYLIGEWLEHLRGLHIGSDHSSEPGLLCALIARIRHIEHHHRELLTMEPAGRAIHFMEGSFADLNLNLGRIAAHTGISVSYLKLLFKRQFDCGPIAYLTELRLAKAEQLLNNPYLRIGEIAILCGFRDPDYFSRLFRRHRNQTPHEFRSHQR